MFILNVSAYPHIRTPIQPSAAHEAANSKHINTHGELERLHEPQRLVDRAPDGQIVHRDLPQDALGIDQVRRAERDAFVGDEAPVGPRELRGTVGEERDVQVWSEAACFAGLLGPGVVRVFRVGGYGCMYGIHSK